jgi:hypothetical protein
MPHNIEQLLDQIEAKHNIAFAHDLRLAIEARGWLTRLGVPFNLEGLLRAILRDGFDEDSAFKDLGVSLTPRASHSTVALHDVREPAPLSDQVVKCLTLSAEICRHFSETQYITDDKTVTVRTGHLGQDSIIFAIAYMAPELIIENLGPPETTSWIRKTARGVAKRALSQRISPSTMYDLKEWHKVREFLQERSDFRGWYLRTFLTRSLVVGGEQYVYMATSEGVNIRNSGEKKLELDGNSCGSHASFCFMGVPQTSSCPDCGELRPPIAIRQATCEQSEDGLPRVVIHLDPDAARALDVPSTIFVEFEDRLTVEEYLVADPATP